MSHGGIGVTGVRWLGNIGQWDEGAKRGIEAVSGTFASGLFPLDFSTLSLFPASFFQR